MYDIDMLEGALRHRDKRIRELEAEREALAAHVERLRTACQMAFQTPLDEHYSKGVNVALCRAIESTAENSLARLKAQWQAEALEEFANEFDPNNEAQDAVISDCLARAEQLRQQAEELS